MSENDVLSKELVDKLTNIVQNPIQDDKLSVAIGQFLFYQNRIEISIEKIILSLSPSLSHFLKHKNRMSFSEKLLLFESLTPDFEKIPLFELLHELNKFRNKVAHKEYADDMFDSAKLVALVQKSFFITIDNLDRLGSAGKITIAVKTAAITSKHIEILEAIEAAGKEADDDFKKTVRLAEIANSSIAKRFRNLIMKFQTGLKDAELKEFQNKSGNFS